MINDLIRLCDNAKSKIDKKILSNAIRMKLLDIVKEHFIVNRVGWFHVDDTTDYLIVPAEENIREVTVEYLDRFFPFWKAYYTEGVIDTEQEKLLWETCGGTFELDFKEEDK